MVHATQPRYDVVVVGARPAGAATALLLARAGARVLVVDRAPCGQDTTSTHALMRGGVVQLQRWGLLDDVVAAGTPAVRRTTFHVGDDVTALTIKPGFGVDALYAPRRTVLDPLVVGAARAAGAAVRHGVTVTGLCRGSDGRVSGIVGHDGRGRTVEATARIVVGADGMSSRVAQWVGAPVERTGSAASAVAYSYWDGLDLDGFHWHYRPGAAAGAIPTNDGRACVFVATTPRRFRADVLRDPPAGLSAVLADAAPELADRLAGVAAAERIRLFPGRPGVVRRSWGPGWALVGDAGYFKDPITAHGLTDALRDGELLARALLDAVGGADTEAGALARYQRTRDRLSAELFAVTDAIAGYAWDVPEVSALLRQLSASMTEEVEHLAALEPPNCTAKRSVRADFTVQNGCDGATIAACGRGGQHPEER